MFHLYDFTFSHYCEKARWALHFKGITYAPHHLLPGFHMPVTRRIAPRSCVPILVTQTTVVQDSTEIINFLERTVPNPPLTPTDPDEANEALGWEEYLDEEIGPTLRRWLYFHTLLPDPICALRDRLKSRRFYHWVCDTFQQQRTRSHYQAA